MISTGQQCIGAFMRVFHNPATPFREERIGHCGPRRKREAIFSHLRQVFCQIGKDTVKLLKNRRFSIPLHTVATRSAPACAPGMECSIDTFHDAYFCHGSLEQKIHPRAASRIQEPYLQAVQARRKAPNPSPPIGVLLPKAAAGSFGIEEVLKHRGRALTLVKIRSPSAAGSRALVSTISPR